ncbi:MAG: hypothetical protein WCA35_23525, partial [Kovacikia sp.]
EYRLLPPAQEFFQRQFPTVLDAQRRNIQIALLTQFQPQKSDINVTSRAQAGLCLRCQVSYPILKACQMIDSLFAGDKQFTYRDLLPFVLNDDGKALIVLDDAGVTQLKLNQAGETQPTTYKLFAVEVLRTYKSNSPTNMSLENWAFLQTKQHPELKGFLSEFGFQHLSDWALLNRVRSGQLEQLSERDRQLVEVFHSVYRRDRRQQQQVSRCLDPTDKQLGEMNGLLQSRGILINPPYELLKALKQVAKQLRQFDIWQSREPLEVQNLETGGYELRMDLPSDSLNEFDAEEQEFLEFLQQQLALALAESIKQAIQSQIMQLEKSKRYAPFAPCFIPGLRLYYCEGLSLREIGPQLGMSSWDQTRRILNPGEILSNVRRLTVQLLLEPILTKAQSQGLASTPPEPNYLKTITEQIEAFIDAEIFAEAASEIKAGKNRSMKSVYAQQLKRYLEQTG